MASTTALRSVLFVCLGNICRSPLAEGVFRSVVEQAGLGARYRIDSAGTGGWHVGSSPDPRSIAVARRHGIDLTAQSCRKIVSADFEAFDCILAMDRSNLDSLHAIAPVRSGNIHLFLEFAVREAVDVPDPYYGGADGFENVYRMIRDGSEALLSKLETRSPRSNGQASSTT